MPTATANGNGNGGVVTGYPVRREDLYRSPPRNGGGAISTTNSQPCNNNNEKLRECKKVSILILVVIGLVFLAFVFSVYCIANENTTPIIRLGSIYVSNFNHNSSHNSTATVSWLLAFRLENPNRYASVHYKKLQASVFNKDKRLSWSNMNDVNQSEWQVNDVYVEIDGLVMDVEEAKEEEADVRVLSLKLDGVVLIDGKYLRNHWRLLEAKCGDIRVISPFKILFLHDYLQCDINLQ